MRERPKPEHKLVSDGQGSIIFPVIRTIDLSPHWPGAALLYPVAQEGNAGARGHTLTLCPPLPLILRMHVRRRPLSQAAARATHSLARRRRVE